MDLIFINQNKELSMKKILVIIIWISSFSLHARPPVPAKLKYSLEFLFSKVLEKKNVPINTKIEFPQFYFESNTSLKQFQDAIEEQWGQRPQYFTNAFSVKNNEIYILDDAAYYKKHQRCMDDSVVHELVHFVQVKYFNWDLSDESLEWDAIDIQTEFRNKFCKS
jgi:hypothetical protein